MEMYICFFKKIFKFFVDCSKKDILINNICYIYNNFKIHKKFHTFQDAQNVCLNTSSILADYNSMFDRKILIYLMYILYKNRISLFQSEFLNFFEFFIKQFFFYFFQELKVVKMHSYDYRNFINNRNEVMNYEGNFNNIKNQ